MYTEDTRSATLSSDEIASQAVDFHETSGIFRTQYDRHTRPVSEAILTAVATATGNDPLELPTLYSAIDPDALDTLFDPPTRSAPNQGLTVDFEYADCRVSANAQGTVVVKPDRE